MFPVEIDGLAVMPGSLQDPDHADMGSGIHPGPGCFTVRRIICIVNAEG
jgi:hypothetical protein